MDEFRIIIEASIPVFLVMAIGFFLRCWNVYTQETVVGIFNIAVNALIPCLIIDSILGNTALLELRNLLSAPLLGIGSLVIGLAVGWYTSSLAGVSAPEDAKKRRSYAVSVGFYNCSYIPFPLALALYDKETVGVLFVFNTGIEVCVWSIIVSILGGYSLSCNWRKIFNVPLIAIIFALALNFLGIGEHIPHVLSHTCHWLGNCAYPVSILMAGGVLYDLCKQQNIFSHLRPTLCASVLRILFLPAIFLFVASFLPLSPEMKRVVILQAAMPTAILAMVLSQIYNADAGTAFRVVVVTTVISFVTTPLWIHLGTQYLF